MFNVSRKTENLAESLNSISKALSDSTIEQVCKLRNQVIHHEVAFVEQQNILIFTLEEIEVWAKKIKLGYKKLEDNSCFPWHNDINGCESDERFRTQRDAMIEAFHFMVIKRADLSDFDLFSCQKCNGYFDIEDSVQIDGDELFCACCATK